LQIILYDTPGVIKKEMHKLDSMMMKNVRSAIGSADCVLVVVDACKMPEKVLQYFKNEWFFSFFFSFFLTYCKYVLLD
jgi:GTPase Era involved in 16S rRNA processing